MHRTVTVILVSVVGVFLTGSAGRCAEYYCDPVGGDTAGGDGSQEHPWGTLQSVLETRNGSPVTAGDRLICLDGDHGTIGGAALAGRMNTDWTTCEAQNKLKARLHGIKHWNSGGDGTAYWKFKGFKVWSDAAASAVYFRDQAGQASHHIWIEDCDVRTVVDTSHYTQDDWDALAKAGANAVYIILKGPGYFTIKNCFVSNSAYGIQVVSNHMTIQGCEFTNWVVDGLGGVGPENVLIEDSVWHARRYAPLYHSDAIDVTGTGGPYRNWTIRRCAWYDIMHAWRVNNGASWCENWLVENVLIETPGGIGVSMQDAVDCTFKNITMIKEFASAVTPGFSFPDNPDNDVHPGGNTIINSLAHGFGGAATTHCLDADTVDLATVFVDWQGRNFRPRDGSPLINAGTPTGAPADDLDGNLRDGQPDIGCYEHGASAPRVTGWRSRGDHGTAGSVWVTLPEDGVEPRAGGIRALRISVNCAVDPATVTASAVGVNARAGGDLSSRVQSATWEPGDGAILVAFHPALAEADRYTVTLAETVTAAAGGALSDRSATFGVLAGDVDGSGAVTAADVLAVREAAGKAVDVATAMKDVNCSGDVTGDDLQAVQKCVGTALPQE